MNLGGEFEEFVEFFVALGGDEEGAGVFYFPEDVLFHHFFE